jgi:hypothetical protein
MEIFDLISLQNPWWQDSSYLPPESNLPKRDLYDRFYQEVIQIKQINSLTGLRRIGKTTLIKQVIAKLLKNHVDPKTIIYFSFDQPTVQENTNTLETVIDFFTKKIVKNNLNQLKQPLYFFLDEIQLIPYWQDIIKRYYDLNLPLKFVVSGSSSLFVSEKSKESLAGRIFSFVLPVFSFEEYQRITNNNNFEEYLNFGQFPELWDFSDQTKKISYLKDSIIAKVLEVDIVKLYKLRKTYDFERLFWSLLPNTGQIIKSSNLMSDLAIKKATLFKYLSILEKSLLINKVLNFSGSFRSEKRLLRKIYPASTNFLTLLPDSLNIGFKIETYVANLLISKQPYLYRLRDKEIDFVLPPEKIAIEVKYQNNINYRELTFFRKYLNEKKFQGIIVVKNDKPLAVEDKNIKTVRAEDFNSFIQKGF